MTADDRGVVANLLISGRTPIEMYGPVTLGREPHATVGDTVVVDDDPLVSKSHLSLDVDGDQIVVTDLGSSNGTYLHLATGETAVPSDSWIPVPDGAEIEFGDQRMRIERATSGPGVADDGATPATGVAAPVPPMPPADPWRPAAPAAAPNSIECARCRRQLAPGSKFCDGCGTPTAAPPAAPAPDAAVPGATVVVPAGGVPAGPAIAPSPVAPAAPVPGGPPSAAPPAGPPPPNGPEFVDLSDTPKSGRAKRVVLGVVAAVVVLAVVGVALSLLLDGDGDGDSSSSSLVVPTDVDELWSESVRGEAIGAAADGRGVYVASVDFGSGETRVVGFDRSDGDELWDVELGVEGSFADAVGTVDDVVVVTVCDEDCTVIGLDRESGEELWDESIGDGFPSIVDGRLIGVDGGTAESFDPRSGARIERVRGDDVTFSNGHVLVTDGDDIEVFDVDLASVAGPEAIDRADAFTFDGRLLIVAEGDELRFIGADGEVVKESVVDVGLIDTMRPVDDDNLVLGSEEGVISVDPRDGVADERWSERGELTAVSDVDGGPVALVDRDGVLKVIDAESGEERFARELDQPDNGFTLSGSNLLVVYEFDGFDDPTEISTYDWVTGDEVWDERFDAFPAVRDGLVIELSRDGDVIVYG